MFVHISILVFCAACTAHEVGNECHNSSNPYNALSRTHGTFADSEIKPIVLVEEFTWDTPHQLITGQLLPQQLKLTFIECALSRFQSLLVLGHRIGLVTSDCTALRPLSRDTSNSLTIAAIVQRRNILHIWLDRHLSGQACSKTISSQLSPKSNSPSEPSSGRLPAVHGVNVPSTISRTTKEH